MRLPLGIHLKSGKRYAFITPEGRPLAPTIRDQVRLLARPQRVPELVFAEVLGRAARQAEQ